VALTDEQVRNLLSRVRNPIHKTCFALMYACGLRLSEAAALEIPAIDKASQILRIIGKGNAERRVPLPQPLLEDLRSGTCSLSGLIVRIRSVALFWVMSAPASCGHPHRMRLCRRSAISGCERVQQVPI
jgi:integrase